MTKFCILIVFLISCEISAQTEFFHSKILFSESQLSDFYSSISVHSSQVYFNANDYKVYAFNKKTGVLNWPCHLVNKTIMHLSHIKLIYIIKHFSECKWQMPIAKKQFALFK